MNLLVERGDSSWGMAIAGVEICGWCNTTAADNFRETKPTKLHQTEGKPVMENETPNTPPPIDPIDPIDPIPVVPPAAATTKDERMWAMFCHLGAIVGGLILSPAHAVFVLPVGNIIVPLVIWMLKKDQYPLVADQGKESLNFQISVSLAFLVCLLIPFLGWFILLPVLAIGALIFCIIATVKANEGVAYRYPYTFRFIK